MNWYKAKKSRGNTGDLAVSTSTATVEQIAEAEARMAAQEEARAARENARDLQLKLQALQSAVRSIVLRLKVLDIDQMEKDMKEDGTVPLRFALSELKELLLAYDGMPKENMWDDSVSTTAQPDYWYQQQQQQYQQIQQQQQMQYAHLWAGTAASTSYTNTGGGQQP